MGEKGFTACALGTMTMDACTNTALEKPSGVGEDLGNITWYRKETNLMTVLISLTLPADPSAVGS